MNELINDELKENILSEFNKIETKLNQMNNLQLIETYKSLQDNYNILGQTIINDNDEELEYNIESELKEDLKNQLKNKINILLNKNPDWKEYLDPVLEELTYSNITMDYINDKLELIIQLDEENKTNPKDQVNNLCLYLKNEINTIELESEQKNQLVELIDDTLNLLYNNDEIDWYCQLKLFNEKCEMIYSKK